MEKEFYILVETRKKSKRSYGKLPLVKPVVTEQILWEKKTTKTSSKH